MGIDFSTPTSTPQAVPKEDKQEKILAALRAKGGRASVPYLIEETKISQSALYRWLGKLAERGLLTHAANFVTLVGIAENSPATGGKSGNRGEKIPTDSQADSHPPYPPCIGLSVGGEKNHVTGVGMGIPAQTIGDLVAKHGESDVAKQLEHLRLVRAHGEEPIRHPEAWLRKAVEGAWEVDYTIAEAARVAEVNRATLERQETERAYRKRTLQTDAAARERLATLTEEEREGLVARATVTDLPRSLGRLLALAVLVDSQR